MNEHNAAIYHFTDGGSIRPIVYQKEVDRLKLFAASKGYPDADMYLDKSLRKKDQLQLQELLQHASNYEAIVMKDFYHLRKNTGACMKELIRLSNQNVNVYTIEDGNFRFEKAPFEQPLKVAIYYCGLEIVERSIDLQLEIMEYFNQTYTSWQLIDQYMDSSGNKIDGNQKQLQELIKNRNQYDIVLVQSFNDIHWRTAKFCKIRHEIQLDIYSLHEDMYLRYGQGGKHE